MKIGIVTLPLHTNYGGILQAYALQTVLERMGHDVEHLQSLNSLPNLHPMWKMPLVWCKRAFRKFFRGESKLPIFTDPRKWITIHTDKFIRTHINCRYINASDWNENLALQYDAIVFGSDQVWRLAYARPIEKYFGSFIGGVGVKRFSYAASFGTEENEFTPEQQQTCSSLLKKFNAVSVREDSAVEMCKNLFDVDAHHHIDPIMLLSPADYVRLCKGKKLPNPDGNMAVYVLDENTQTDAFVEKLSKHNGLKPYRINSKVENYSAPITERQQPPLEGWLKAFDEAEYIVTDSFHACVFSIIFNKPFICLGNSFRGNTRFNSLLCMFGLEDRMIDCNVSLIDLPDSPIDWSSVNDILAEKRKEAQTFLETVLA